MGKNNLFIENYNKENGINIKSNLDIHDECSFSYLDILKEKEVEVISKVVSTCKCCESVNFNTYYDKCEKCNGLGKLFINGNEVVCNHCHGKKKIVKNICPLCAGEGEIIKEGKVKVKLNKTLKNGDVVTVKNKGKESNGIQGDLFIKVIVSDLDCFDIKGNDVYDKRIIAFSKEEISKGVSKTVETVKGSVKVKSNGELINEIVKIDNQGIDEGDYYICLKNERVEIKGDDVYKNVVINKKMLGFYLDREEFASDKKVLTVHYFKKVNSSNFEYIELDDVNNFKVVKLKEKGIEGKYGGLNGDLYLRVYFDDEFKVVDDRLYSYPIKLTKYEINEGKKILEFNKAKVILNFNKNLKEEQIVEVKDMGLMTDKSNFEGVNFIVNPFAYEIYKVSVKASKKDKVIYLKDYKKYFYEEVKLYNEGLKVNLNKKNESELIDDEGNKVIVRVIR